MRRGFALAVLLLVVGGCGVTPEEVLDPEAIPSGPIGAAPGQEPIQNVFELGTGVMSGVGWRYSIYSDDGEWCTLLETIGHSGGTCGGMLPGAVSPFGQVNRDSIGTGEVSSVDGLVSPEVATVWVVFDEVDRIPAVMMSLEETGLDGSAFVAVVPSDRNVTHLLAVAPNGEILETFELP
jgi:hypothetical protein